MLNNLLKKISKEYFRKEVLLIVAGFLIFSAEVQSQRIGFCQTPPQSTNYLQYKSSAAFDKDNTNHYCLRIYFHVIRRSNGTGGQSVQAVHRAYQILKQDYHPHNISFYWDNQIDYINSDTYYSSPSASIFNVNKHNDGIDIYLFGENVANGGLANGVGNSGEFYVGGNFWNTPYYSLVTSHVISHEMGHVLFLWHTHHGTYPEGGNDNPCKELVNGSNSTVCGDYVEDTPADPHLQFNVNPNSCAWQSSGTDANGHSYNPDTKNIMSYTIPSCMSYFSEKQGERMRNSIDALPYLQNALINCSNCTMDLMVKDSPEDVGLQPNTQTGEVLWNSSDIWVRNSQDGGLTNQNPISAPFYRNYVYVKVQNIGCGESNGTEKLNVYWAKAGTNLWWPESWTGGDLFPNGAIRGDMIGTMTIPKLRPGEEFTINFPWTAPNPNDYLDITPQMDADRWHFCLLARIESTDDPMIHTNGADFGNYVGYNNNVAWKNVSVIDTWDGYTGAIIAVGNVYKMAHPFKLEFKAGEEDRDIFKEAEITIRLSDKLFDIWKQSGKGGEGIREMGDNTLMVVGDNASLDNLKFAEDEVVTLDLHFNFLTQGITDKETFEYHVVQRDAESGIAIGGEVYEVNKKKRDLFFADAGNNICADKNETVVLKAVQIGEPAVYNWYDQGGNLIHEGADFTTSVSIAQRYKLEVIALADGYKDYAEVDVQFKPNQIKKVFPNPLTSGQLSMEYEINEANNAYVSITNYQYPSISNNYILDLATNSLSLNLQNYPAGVYVITLICNGKVSDSKTFIKQ